MLSQFSTERHGHSETSWNEMWKEVFTKLEGPQFVANSLDLQAHLFVDGNFGGGDIPQWQKISMMTWSVRLI